MTKFTLKIKPLSINMAFQGRRFKTAESRRYDNSMSLILPNKKEPGPFYSIQYDFYLKNFLSTDYDNLIKQTQDCIVRKGIISDDRRIIKAIINKYMSDEDGIAVEIESFSDCDGTPTL